MSKDLTTSGPSRRSIAKGAAWAVPAVSVAAAAPALAASTTLPVCTTATVAPVCPGLLGTTSLYFTITNPASSGCVIPVGTQITVDRGGLAGVEVGPLNAINVQADLLFSNADTALTQRALQPGDSIQVHIFPPGLANVAALQNATVGILGASAAQGYTIVSVGALTVAVCGLG